MNTTELCHLRNVWRDTCAGDATAAVTVDDDAADDTCAADAACCSREGASSAADDAASTTDADDAAGGVVELSFEEVDQLRCYLQCAVLLEDDHCAADLEGNYEPLDFEPVRSMIGRPRVRLNRGIDPVEVLMNLSPFMAIAGNTITRSEIAAFFAHVVPTADEAAAAADRLLVLLRFLELIAPATTADAPIDLGQLLYTYALYVVASRVGDTGGDAAAAEA